jgi:hypothetical protein
MIPESDPLLKWGDEAEKTVLDYLNKYDLNAQHNKVISDNKESIYDNLKWGDIFIDHERIRFSFDVKRGHFVSENSLKCYKGMFYIFISNGDLSDPANFKVVKTSTVKHYMTNVPENKMHTGPSGSKGYRFTKLKNFVLLGDFVTEFIKRVIILNNEQTTDLFVKPWSEYMIRNFTKVLPQHINAEDSVLNTYLKRG